MEGTVSIPLVSVCATLDALELMYFDVGEQKKGSRINGTVFRKVVRQFAALKALNNRLSLFTNTRTDTTLVHVLFDGDWSTG